MFFKKRGVNKEAVKALKDSEKSLEEVKKNDSEIRAVSKELKAIRERNHFAEQLTAIIGGHTK